jgi:peptidyl-tRNA hydrolase, PTH1 family
VRLFRRGESASTLDLLVVGLGNPGREHAQDRHNAGWMIVDELARRHGGSFRSKFSGQLAEVRVGDLKLALLKPETYMNLSGSSLAAEGLEEAQRRFN